MFPRVYKEYPPAEHLRHYIKCYWLFEKKYAPGEFEHVFPDSSYELAYIQTGRYEVNHVRLPHLFLVGQLKKPLDFYAEGAVRQWAVRFYPWGLQPFGKVQHIGSRPWLPAKTILPTEAADQLTKIMKQTDDAKVLAQLDDYFMRRLLSWRFNDTVLHQAVEHLRQFQGDIKLKELAEYCFISQRQLSRKIVNATGRTPHDVASLLRFEQVRNSIMHNPEVPLTFLAHQQGYVDQSHLIKEFRQYMEMTPSQYANQVRSYQSGLQNLRNVQFLQSETSPAG